MQKVQKVLVVIVVYNGEAVLVPCLDSVLKSDYPLDVFVWDNASSDASIEILKTYETLFLHQKKEQIYKLILSEKNVGFGIANNAGLSYALDNQYDFAFLLNQDAWLQADTISKLLPLALANPDWGIVSPLHLNREGTNLDPNHALHLGKEAGLRLDTDELLAKKHTKNYTIPISNAAAWLLSRAFLEQVGGFDPLFFLYGEDNDLNQRRIFHGFQMGFVPAAHIHHARYKPPQASAPTQEALYQRTLRRNMAEHLTYLKNINLSWSWLICKSFSYLLKRWLLFRKQKDGIAQKTDWQAFKEVWKNRRQILQNRAICKQKNRNFI
ncbi:glycosyltransferase family 2 protein [Hugenholtzia roseola]|uniref:glycosyltransferase family 2 protein n=1 Tax=Hugenholtzia roseola TaxID=1002 RepID=UPI000684D0A6|nr:glycosyltransferase family 2 protein [Hugenholtzia roseola]